MSSTEPRSNEKQKSAEQATLPGVLRSAQPEQPAEHVCKELGCGKSFPTIQGLAGHGRSHAAERREQERKSAEQAARARARVQQDDQRERKLRITHLGRLPPPPEEPPRSTSVPAGDPDDPNGLRDIEHTEREQVERAEPELEHDEQREHKREHVEHKSEQGKSFDPEGYLKSVDAFMEKKLKDWATDRGIVRSTPEGGSPYTEEGGIRTWETPDINAARAST